MQCPICFDVDPITIYDCGHKICLICSTRMFYLFDNRKCPLCLHDSVDISYTEPIDGVNKKIQHLLSFNCTKCDDKFSNFHLLKNHCSKKHSLMLCNICYPSKNVFPFEYELLTKEEIMNHKYIEHVYCTFCNKWYFNTDNCKSHCIMKHFQCPLCIYKYFISYADLLKHYKESHYVCLERECEKSDYIFKSREELTAHYKNFHYLNLKPEPPMERKETVKYMNPTHKERLTLKEIKKKIAKIKFTIPKKEFLKKIENNPSNENTKKIEEKKIEYLKNMLLKEGKEYLNIFLDFNSKKISELEFIKQIFTLSNGKDITNLMTPIFKILKNKSLEDNFNKFNKERKFPAFKKTISVTTKEPIKNKPEDTSYKFCVIDFTKNKK